jgi:hypothetical protein
MTSAERFACLIEGLWRTIQVDLALKHVALMCLILNGIRRTGRRFASLVARIEAGTLTPPRPRSAPRKPAAARPPVRRPRGFAWVRAMVVRNPGAVSGWAGELEQLLATAEMAPLIGADPAAHGPPPPPALPDAGRPRARGAPPAAPPAPRRSRSPV